MIVCPKCQAKNSPGSNQCQNCGRNLLPGETAKDRLFALIGGIILGVIGVFVAYFLFTHPDVVETSELCMFTDPIFWVIVAIGGPIAGFISVIRKTPEYRRYELRALRHKAEEPAQALEDYNRAIELAPKKNKAALVKARSGLYQFLGQEEDSIKDQLDYMTMDGAYDEAASFVSAVFGGDKDTYVNQSIRTDRRQLLSEGKIRGVAYCRKCRQVVELNEKQKCPIHRKGKLLEETYVLPKDYEEAIRRVEVAAKEKDRKLRVRRTIIWALVGLFLTLCVVIPLIVSLFED